jgi:hypothetical protein
LPESYYKNIQILNSSIWDWIRRVFGQQEFFWVQHFHLIHMEIRICMEIITHTALCNRSEICTRIELDTCMNPTNIFDICWLFHPTEDENVGTPFKILQCNNSPDRFVGFRLWKNSRRMTSRAAFHDGLIAKYPSWLEIDRRYESGISEIYFNKLA